MTARLVPLTEVAARLGGVSVWIVRELIPTRQLGTRVSNGVSSCLNRNWTPTSHGITVPAAAKRSGRTVRTTQTPKPAPDPSSGIQRLVDIRALCGPPSHEKEAM